MRIVILQPALPSYRLDFFQRLADQFGEKLVVYYSPTDMGALTQRDHLAPWERPLGPMYHPIRDLEWQQGALSIPLARGDILVVCGAPRNVSMLLLLVRARILGVRTVWWGQYWSATTKNVRHRIRMKLSRLAQALLFYTDAEVSRFQADGWMHSGPIGALNNGIDLAEVKRHRQPYDPAARGSNLLFVGRLTSKARLHLVIDALAEPALNAVTLHIIGSGAEEASLRRQSAVRNVTDRIVWHGGTVDESRISAIANTCACFVYPGQVGLSLIHAMGYGLPCIVHNRPDHHMPEIAAFQDGKTGMSFEEDDITTLALAIATLLKDPSKAQDMSDRCLRTLETSFTTEGMAQRFIAFMQIQTPDEGS